MIFCSPRFGVVFMLSDANLEIITFEKICFCVFILLFVICRLALVQLVYCASVCFKRIFISVNVQYSVLVTVRSVQVHQICWHSLRTANKDVFIHFNRCFLSC